MKLPKELTTVTPLSKYLAMVVFLALPFIGFFMGVRYQEMLDLGKRQQTEDNLTIPRTPTPTQRTVASIDWQGLIIGKYMRTNNYIKASNNWSIGAEMENKQSNVSLMDYIKSLSYISLPISQKQLTINGYEAVIEELFEYPVGNSVVAYIVNNSGDKVVRIYGIPKIPIENRVDIKYRLSSKFIDEFQGIISTFRFAQ